MATTDNCYHNGPSLVTGISDPEYRENLEITHLDLVSRMYERYERTECVIPEAQRRMYHAITDTFLLDVKRNLDFPKFIWSPTVIDVGCGCGVGSNILSQSADFVWGIDKNRKSIRFAQQMFARTKNEIYWSPQVSFDMIDVTNEPREVMRFDVVVCIEVIEHLADYHALLSFLKRSGKPAATYFISSPNRAAWRGTSRAKRPLNPYHVREWNACEFKKLLLDEFTDVELCNRDLAPVPADTTETPVLARCTL